MKRILVVDDTKNIRMLLSKCLELEGYNVDSASDGKMALELFKKNKYDLAFLDIKLPEVRGTEVLRRIREMGIDTPVVIITAYATVKNAVDCTKMGAVAYLQKPFTGEKIMSMMKEIFNENTSKDNIGPTSSEPGVSSLSTSISINSLMAEAVEYINSGNGEKALGILKNLLSIDNENPEIYKLLSRAYMILGNREMSSKFNSMYELIKS